MENNPQNSLFQTEEKEQAIDLKKIIGRLVLKTFGF